VKFMNGKYSAKFCNAPDYPEVIKKVLAEMHRQVGDLTFNSDGIVERGLLIRHLVMPKDVASPEEVLRFIAEEISVNSYVNIMDQYRPEYLAHDHPEINRRTTRKEYLEAVEVARRYHLHRGF